jgi:response regulator RpfG family c-di-GMP phosphodiesterase
MSPSAAQSTSQDSQPQEKATRVPTVLFIDDDPQILEAIARRLRRYEIEVLQAYHGMQGYWMAVTAKPDVIVTDLRMPQGDGETVLECLKRNAQTATIPVVVLTGKQQSGLKRHMENVGAAGYLSKPVKFEDLVQELNRHIEVRRSISDSAD